MILFLLMILRLLLLLIVILFFLMILILLFLLMIVPTLFLRMIFLFLHFLLLVPPFPILPPYIHPLTLYSYDPPNDPSPTPYPPLPCTTIIARCPMSIHFPSICSSSPFHSLSKPSALIS